MARQRLMLILGVQFGLDSLRETRCWVILRSERISQVSGSVLSLYKFRPIFAT